MSKDLQTLNGQNKLADFGVPQQWSEGKGLVQGKWHL